MRVITRGAVLAPFVLTLGACDAGVTLPDRPADAVGTASAVEAEAGEVRVQFEHDPGYEYYEGTVLVLDDEVTVVGAADGARAIEAGDALRVWTGLCAESFPVRCEIEAVEVLDLSP